MKFLISLLFSINCFSQAKPLELVIDNLIHSTNAENEQEYTLDYHITNNSNKTVFFVLDTKSMIPINSGSLRPKPYYKIYEKEKEFSAGGILSIRNSYLTFTSEEAFKKYQDSAYVAERSKTRTQFLSERKEQLISNIKKLEPNESLKVQTKLYWNKQRYFKDSTFEYYIQENEKYYFELHIHLMKEELLLDLSENERNEILKGLNLTKGWYTSNRVAIDFSQ